MFEKISILTVLENLGIVLLKRKEKSRDQTESLKWTREKNRNSNANDRFLLDTNS